MTIQTHKNGIYGETPVIRIGKYTLAETRINEDDSVGSSIRIQEHDANDDMQEGGEFHKELIEKEIEAIFNKYF